MKKIFFLIALVLIIFTQCVLHVPESAIKSSPITYSETIPTYLYGNRVDFYLSQVIYPGHSTGDVYVSLKNRSSTYLHNFSFFMQGRDNTKSWTFEINNLSLNPGETKNAGYAVKNTGPINKQTITINIY